MFLITVRILHESWTLPLLRPMSNLQVVTSVREVVKACPAQSSKIELSPVHEVSKRGQLIDRTQGKVNRRLEARLVSPEVTAQKRELTSSSELIANFIGSS